MYQIALQQPAQANVISFQDPVGIVTHIRLNYHEVLCIELALIGLAERIRNKDLPEALIGFSVDHLTAQWCYLNYWLNCPRFKSQLRLDGKNRVLWPFSSSELVDWLLRICQSCINEDAILIAAADAARCEYADFAEIDPENANHYSLADEGSYSSVSVFQGYYNNIVTTCLAVLVRKLAAICEQHYPLFPSYALIN